MCGSNKDWEDKGKKRGGSLNCDLRRSALRWLRPFPYSLPLPKKLFLHNSPLSSAAFSGRSIELKGHSQGHSLICLHLTLSHWNQWGK